MKHIISLLLLFISIQSSVSAQSNAHSALPWNTNSRLNSYRLFEIMDGTKPEFIDLDKDGDPDVMLYTTANGFHVQWIDDDDDMK